MRSKTFKLIFDRLLHAGTRVRPLMCINKGHFRNRIDDTKRSCHTCSLYIPFRIFRLNQQIRSADEKGRINFFSQSDICNWYRWSSFFTFALSIISISRTRNPHNSRAVKNCATLFYKRIHVTYAVLQFMWHGILTLEHCIDFLSEITNHGSGDTVLRPRQIIRYETG